MTGEHDFYAMIMALEEVHKEVSEGYLRDEILSSLGNRKGWVFQWPERDEKESSLANINTNNVSGRTIREKIIVVLRKITSEMPTWSNFLVQFWAPKVVEGRRYLTTLYQPFAVEDPATGICWYRKQCVQDYYMVDDGAQEEEVGPPGRVFRNGHPESSPDLRLYSTKEFPLRDPAVHCGFTAYWTLPVFDLHQKQCVGVLEILSSEYPMAINFRFNTCFLKFSKALEEADLRSTHILNLKNQQLLPGEISEMLEVAIETVPQLHLALVWVPCKQCDSISNQLSCLERVARISNMKGVVCTSNEGEFCNMGGVFEAVRFLNIKNGGVVGLALSSPNKSCFCRNLCEFSMSEYSMAHNAQIDRLSFCFAICLQSKHNVKDLYVVEFFLQSQSREDAYIWSVLHVMEMKLKSFQIATGRNLQEKFVVDEIRKKNMSNSSELGQNSMFPFGYESILHSLKKEHQHSKENELVTQMKGYDTGYSLTVFKECLQKTDMSSLQQTKTLKKGWLFWSEGEELSENGVIINSVQKKELNPIQQTIKLLLVKISRCYGNPNCLIQFWAPKMIDNRPSLTTLNQPFGLAVLRKGLCELRNQCIKHHYYVDDGTKEKQLGPPGRVFQNGHLESSPDLRLYSATEFPLRDHLVRCGGRTYFAIPLFDLCQEQCVGVLEIVEFYYRFGYGFDLGWIEELLKETNLRTSHINCGSSFQATHLSTTNLAFMEIKAMFNLVIKTPQLHLAQVWVPCSQSANINCLERREFAIKSSTFIDRKTDHFLQACRCHQVQNGKGVIGRILESENKLCFCQSLCDFGIIEQPLAHYAQVARLDTCFAIGLQSSHTGNNLYVLEFFLSRVNNEEGYPWSFLCSLLSTMKQNLRSFKVASGQQIGDELTVEVIEFCKENECSSFELGQLGMLPLRVQVVQYGHEMEHPHLKDQRVHFESDAMDSAENVVDKEQNFTTANFDDVITTNNRSKERNKTSFHISYDDLELHFGMRLVDVAEKLGVSKSTLKRVCRSYGINRWPSNVKNKRNPSLFEPANANKRVRNSDKQISIPSGNNLPSSDIPIQQKFQSTQQLTNRCSEADVLIVKATFKDDIIKVQLCLSLGIEKLMEEVGKRLKLEIGSFKLKYLDEDDQDWILLACDDDLHLCVKRLRSLDKSTVKVLVQLISN